MQLVFAISDCVNLLITFMSSGSPCPSIICTTVGLGLLSTIHAITSDVGDKDRQRQTETYKER